MIEVTTLLTEEIFIEYYAFALFRSKNPRFKRAITMVLLPLFSSTILFMTNLQRGSWLGYVVGFLGLALFTCHAYMLGPGVKKQYQSLPDSLKVPQKLTFGETNIIACCEWEGELQESSYTYKNVAVQETEAAVYIFVAEGQALILSKAQLSNQINDIVDLLKREIPENQYMICFRQAKRKEKKNVQI